MSEKHTVTKDPITGVETTGHVWDDTLQEFNNPLPAWWIWAFYLTIIFSIVYWVLYPAWPTGFAEGGFTKGVKTVTFNRDLIEDGKRIVGGGEEITVHWSTRAILAHEMQNDPNELKRQAMAKKVAGMSIADVAKDADTSAFVRAYGKGIFGDYCAACHQAGGQGIIGHFPNLVDDAWLWGADPADIETTIRKGKIGNMPSHEGILNAAEITAAAHYVLSLSGEETDPSLVEKGKVIYNTKGCSGCHMPAATGMKALGAPNLTDKIWTDADVPGAKTAEDKVNVVKAVIKNGFSREMPSFESRLSDDEIKVLVAYIKLLSAN